MARELNSDPRVLIANQPTRGLDVGAAEYVRTRIIEARNSGTACLVISADLEENLTAFGSYRRDLQRDANGDSSARKRPAGNRRVDDGEEGGGSSS